MSYSDKVKVLETSNGKNIVFTSSETRYSRRSLRQVRYYHVFVGCHRDEAVEHDGITRYGYLTRFNFTNKAEAIKYAKSVVAPVIGSPDRSIQLSNGLWIWIENATSAVQAGHRGIHLLNPTQDELADAIERAGRDYHAKIWIHTEDTFAKTA